MSGEARTPPATLRHIEPPLSPPSCSGHLPPDLQTNSLESAVHVPFLYAAEPLVERVERPAVLGASRKRMRHTGSVSEQGRTRRERQGGQSTGKRGQKAGWTGTFQDADEGPDDQQSCKMVGRDADIPAGVRVHGI